MSIVTPVGQPTSPAGAPAAPLPETGRQARAVPPAPGPGSGGLPVPVWVIAAVFVAVELAVSGRYGFLQDELYLSLIHI